MYIDKNDFICTYHNIIIKHAKKLLKLIDLENDVAEGLIQEILICAKYAKSSGMRMENRLNLYKNSIEELGFKRIKK